jgi:hypothetical protein
MAAREFTMTREEYDALSPRQQGYVTYMRAEWPGAQIPKSNPYPSESPCHDEWQDGARAAYILVLDSDDD